MTRPRSYFCHEYRNYSKIMFKVQGEFMVEICKEYVILRYVELYLILEIEKNQIFATSKIFKTFKYILNGDRKRTQLYVLVFFKKKLNILSLLLNHSTDHFITIY